SRASSELSLSCSCRMARRLSPASRVWRAISSNCLLRAAVCSALGAAAAAVVALVADGVRFREDAAGFFAAGLAGVGALALFECEALPLVVVFFLALDARFEVSAAAGEPVVSPSMAVAVTSTVSGRLSAPLLLPLPWPLPVVAVVVAVFLLLLRVRVA